MIKKIYSKLLILSLLMGIGIQLQAAIYYVNPGATPTAPYNTWATGFKTVNAALAAVSDAGAYASDAAPVIRVAAGSYTLTNAATYITNRSFTLEGGYAVGGTTYDPVANLTTFNFTGTVNPFVKIINSGSTARNVAIRGFTETGDVNGGLFLDTGTANTPNTNFVFQDIQHNGGAAMYRFGQGSTGLTGGSLTFTNVNFDGCTTQLIIHMNSSVTPVLTNCSIKNSSAGFGAADGGIIQLVNNTANPVMTIDPTCSFYNNTVYGNNAGIFYLKNCTGSLTINSNTPIDNNKNINPDDLLNGGTVVSTDGCSGTLNLINTTFSNNSGYNGAVVHIQGTSSGPVNITNSTFTSNFAGTQGGVIHYAGNTGLTTVRGSTFKENNANGGGGGVFAVKSFSSTPIAAPLTVIDSYFCSNHAPGGYGGVYNASDQLGDVSWTNCVFNSNTAGTGGALSRITTSTIYEVYPFVIDKGSFYDNQAGVGGAMWLTSGVTVTISNSVFLSNVANSGRGGAIGVNSGPLAVTNCNFTSNMSQGSSSLGGAISTTGLNLSNAIFDNNSTDGGFGGALWGSGSVDKATFKDNNTPQGYTTDYAMMYSRPSWIVTNSHLQVAPTPPGATNDALGQSQLFAPTVPPTGCTAMPLILMGVTGVPETGTIPSTGGTPITNVRSNDLVNGLPATAANSTINQSGTWPSGITLNTTTGAVVVAAGTAPGSYTMTYRLCDLSSNCTLVIDQVTVTAAPVLNPDFNVTNVNVPVPGNVSTNDVVPTGTTYGTPTASAGNPSGGTITLTPTGSYTFTATSPGTYTYTVPVCPPGVSTGCPTTPLIITVLDNSSTTNPPVANPDYASTNVNTPVTVNVKANDGPGNPGGTLGTPTIVVPPAHGTATVDGSGNVVYTPTTGYVGDDVLTYQVCETPGGLCKTATETIHVVAPGSTTVTAVDDYAKTPVNTPVSGNVLTNDIGSGLTVSNAGTITSPGKGTLVLGSNGSYTFTPTPGVTGPVDFTYTACASGPVCSTATLHILVTPTTPVLNPDFNVTNVNVPVPGNVSTNDVVPTGTTYGTPTASAGNPSGGTITLTPTGSYTFTATSPGTYTYTVPVCAPGQSTGCPTTPLIITVLDPNVTTNPPVANPDYASTNVNTPVTVNVKANDGPGNPGGTLGTPTIVVAPAHGTATVDGSGNVVYTPATGYVGDDILTYQVCETPGGLCKTATETIHVVAPGSTTVTAVDDYNKTPANTPVSGNVLTNDIGSGLTVSNAGTTVTSSGTLVLGSNGAYTFTPTPGVSGPVDFTYTACDSGPVCSTATLHILVTPAPDLAPIIYALPATQYGTTNFTVVVDVYNLQSTVSSGLITVYLTKDPLVNLSFTPGSVLVGGKPVQNSIWTFDGTTDPDAYIFTTTQVIAGEGSKSIGLTGVLTPGNTQGTLTISTTVVPGSGGEVRVNNNSDADKIDYFKK